MAQSRIGTNLNQADYEKLEQSAYKQLNETEAKALINRWFGFEFSQIELISEVDTWEVDETDKSGRKWQHKAKHSRQPLYDATDWNYIRFNVKGYQYELVNGSLYFYED